MPTEDHTSSDRSHQGLPQGGGVELSLDELAKGLASGTLSRGKAIRWMGGALLGAALASVPGVAWANDCRRLGRECRRDSQCCSRNCIRRGDDKVCGCPEGKTRCNDRCVNLNRNDNHCGDCFNRCEAGEECMRGECQGGGCDGQICGDSCCTAEEGCYFTPPYRGNFLRESAVQMILFVWALRRPQGPQSVSLAKVSCVIVRSVTPTLTAPRVSFAHKPFFVTWKEIDACPPARY